MRSYLGLSLGLSFCMMFAVGCGDDATSTGGTGGTGGSGGAAGEGGSGGEGGTGGGGVTKNLTLGCANSSPLGAQSILSADLTVAVGTIAASTDFDARLSGTSTFPEGFLDAAQALVPGGLSQAKVTDIQYIVQVRSGATLVNGGAGIPGVSLRADGSKITPGEVRLCNFPLGQECTADSDCTGMICNPTILVVDVPTSDDCATGGVCDGLGKATGPTSQCVLNDFCVTGDLALPLLEVTQTYTADATGDVLFGWADQGLSNNTFDAMTNLFTLPKPSTLVPIEQGLQVDAGLVVSVECVMGTDGGEDPEDAENTLVGLTPDSDLLSFPIEP